MAVHKAEFVRAVNRWSDLPATSIPEVAFVGRSNVGKSSLINRLLGRRALAHTSGTPGKTRTLNFYRIDDAVHLVDMPGLGYARVSKGERAGWVRLIQRYLGEREQLCGVIHLVDIRHPPTPIDLDFAAAIAEADRPYIVVLTKSDKLSRNAAESSRRRAQREIASESGLEVPVLVTSAHDGTGRDELAEWIDMLAGVQTFL